MSSILGGNYKIIRQGLQNEDFPKTCENEQKFTDKSTNFALTATLLPPGHKTPPLVLGPQIKIFGYADVMFLLVIVSLM